MKLLLASAPSYGKVHNDVYCYAYFAFSDITEAKDDPWIFFLEGGA